MCLATVLLASSINSSIKWLVDKPSLKYTSIGLLFLSKINFTSLLSKFIEPFCCLFSLNIFDNLSSNNNSVTNLPSLLSITSCAL